MITKEMLEENDKLYEETKSFLIRKGWKEEEREKFSKDNMILDAYVAEVYENTKIIESNGFEKVRITYTYSFNNQRNFYDYFRKNNRYYGYSQALDIVEGKEIRPIQWIENVNGLIKDHSKSNYLILVKNKDNWELCS